MAVRKVLSLPEEILKKRSVEVGGVADRALAQDLIDTMDASPACVGLAAPQIGVARRAFVVDVSSHPKATTTHGTIVMFDPALIETSGREIGREGCMSVPDLTANVARALRIVIRGIDLEGRELTIATEGFEARAFQHELDHLDGLLILDRVASLASDVFRRKTYR